MPIDAGPPSVFLVEPNAPLRRAIQELLVAEQYGVVSCETLDQVLESATGGPGEVALVAWQSMDGLLTDGRRDVLAEVTGRLRLVLMVPRRWQRLLDASEFGVAAMVAKPFNADELLDTLRASLAFQPRRRVEHSAAD